MKEIIVFYSGPVSKEGEGVLQQVEGVEDPHPHPLIEVESLRSLSLNVSWHKMFDQRYKSHHLWRKGLNDIEEHARTNPRHHPFKDIPDEVWSLSQKKVLTMSH